jgi:tetratricopeptide (TPR) repeat protein
MNRSSRIMMIALILVSAGNAHAAKNTPADPSMIPYKELLNRNNRAFSELWVGMSKDELIATMGSYSAVTENGFVMNPVRRESFTVGTDSYEKLLYLSAGGPNNAARTRTILIENGKVVVWERPVLTKAKNSSSITPKANAGASDNQRLTTATRYSSSGQEHFTQGRFSEAIDDFKRAIAEMGEDYTDEVIMDDTGLYLFAAQIEQKNGRLENAAHTLDEIVSSRLTLYER